MADAKPFYLGPFAGIDERKIDDRQIQGTAMRGGYNVIPSDGEWWTRGGTRFGNGQPDGGASPFTLGDTAGPVWLHIVQDGTYLYYVSKYVIARTNGLAWEIPYSPVLSENCDFTVNSPTVVTTTLWTVGQMMVYSGRIYYVMSAGGAGPFYANVHTPIVGATAAAVLTGRWEGFVGGNFADTAVGKSGVCIFNAIAHAAADWWAAQPQIFAGRYLIFTHADLDPIAIRMGTVSALVTAFWRDTSSAAAAVAAVAGKPYYCESFKGRLVLGRCGDPNSLNRDYTIWTSRVSDLVGWHTGTRGTNGVASYSTYPETSDVIQGLKAMNDQLIVHKQQGQIALTASGSAVSIFNPKHNRQGIGVSSPTSILNIEGRQFFWSNYGPASFDGTTVRYLRPSLYELMKAFGIVSTTVQAVHLTARGVILWTFQTSTGQREYGTPGVSGGGVLGLIFDYRRNQLALVDFPSDGTTASVDNVIYGMADASFRYPQFDVVMSFRSGKASVWSLQGGVTYDSCNYSAMEQPMQWRADTQWMNFGAETQKDMLQLDVELRALDAGQDAFTGLVVGDRYRMNCDIYTDFDHDTIRQSVNFDYVHAVTTTTRQAGLRFEATRRITKNVKLSGRVFKFSFHNENVTDGSLDTDNVVLRKGPARIGQVVVWMLGGESKRTEN